MEVLAGTRDEKREEDLRPLLGRFELLSFDAATDFDGALRIYRRCRIAGIIPAGHARLHDRGCRMAPGRNAARPRCGHGPCGARDRGRARSRIATCMIWENTRSPRPVRLLREVWVDQVLSIVGRDDPARQRP